MFCLVVVIDNLVVLWGLIFAALCTVHVGLETEGLYRKSGERAKIRQLILAFNQDPRSVVIDPDTYLVHDVTGTLKHFFQSLPDPLFTHHLYSPFLSAGCKLWNSLDPMLMCDLP